MRLHIIDGKLLQLGAVHAQVGGFFESAFGVPMIHGNTLDEPHRGRAPAARAMDERWFRAFGGNCVENLSAAGGIRRIAVESDPVVSQTRGLGCLARFDVRAGLGRLAEIDDRYEAHFLDVRQGL